MIRAIVSLSSRRPRKAPMASKDKGGKSSKTAASKTQKEKRDAKREKKQVRGKQKST